MRQRRRRSDVAYHADSPCQGLLYNGERRKLSRKGNNPDDRAIIASTSTREDGRMSKQEGDRMPRHGADRADRTPPAPLPPPAVGSQSAKMWRQMEGTPGFAERLRHARDQIANGETVPVRALGKKQPRP